MADAYRVLLKSKVNNQYFYYVEGILLFEVGDNRSYTHYIMKTRMIKVKQSCCGSIGQKMARKNLQIR